MATKKKVTRKKRKPARKKIVRRKVARKKTPAKKRAVKKVTKRKRVSPMAKRKKRRVRRAVKRVYSRAKRAGSRVKSGLGLSTKNLQSILIKGGIGAGGAVVAGYITQRVPIPNEKIKTFLPLLLGIGIGSTKWGKTDIGNSLAVGLVTIGAIQTIKKFLPQVPLLSGDEELMDYDATYLNQEDPLYLEGAGADNYEEDLGEDIEFGEEFDDSEIDSMLGEEVIF